MPKVGMEPIRRQQLIDATIVSIGRYGLADTTVQRISQAAGVSSGIIHHYFGGKNELLEATMRRLLQSLRADVVAALGAAPTPEQRGAPPLHSKFAAGPIHRGGVAPPVPLSGASPPCPRPPPPP